MWGLLKNIALTHSPDILDNTMHIWQKLKLKSLDLKRPLSVLAPMADVTDVAFRTLIAECGNPDMMWTEFVSADGLVRATPEGKKKLLADLQFGETERPIVAQLFGSRPEYMEEASYLVASLGFDGIDINMGCPDKSIEKQGAGAGMIKNPKRAQEIILAAKKGAERWARECAEKRGACDEVSVGKGSEIFEPIPVSVKTRIGYNKNELETWLPALLEAKPALITVHARTRKEMSKVPARWEHVAEAVKIRDRVQADLLEIERTLIFGNGDVLSVDDGMEKSVAAGADGAMLGRALFGNPWLFSGLKNSAPKNFVQHIPSLEEKLHMTIRHAELFEKHLGNIKSFAIMKKHFKAYINDFEDAKELRTELMERAENANDVKNIIENFLKSL